MQLTVVLLVAVVVERTDEVVVTVFVVRPKHEQPADS